MATKKPNNAAEGLHFVGGLAGRVLDRVSSAARQLPGAEFAEDQLHNIEHRILRELKGRLEALDNHRRLPTPEGYSPPADLPAGGSPITGGFQHPAILLHDLLERSANQNEQQAKLYLYSMILRELVPDEVRLLGALSDGSSHPLLHVGIGPPFGVPQRRIAENITNVGKTALVKLRDFVPAYITHLRNLDLVETGPEDKEFEVQYQILESESIAREATEYAAERAGPGMGARFIRRVIKISPLGRELWQACEAYPPSGE